VVPPIRVTSQAEISFSREIYRMIPTRAYPPENDVLVQYVIIHSALIHLDV
jgi:hypothetical protein